jgi:hypothetical protein
MPAQPAVALDPRSLTGLPSGRTVAQTPAGVDLSWPAHTDGPAGESLAEKPPPERTFLDQASPNRAHCRLQISA